jgi:hypothetical protein
VDVAQYRIAELALHQLGVLNLYHGARLQPYDIVRGSGPARAGRPFVDVPLRKVVGVPSYRDVRRVYELRPGRRMEVRRVSPRRRRAGPARRRRYGAAARPDVTVAVTLSSPTPIVLNQRRR